MSNLKPDFKRIYKVATEDVLIGSNTILSLPVDIHSHIIDETDIKLCTYDTAIRKYGVNIVDMGSKDAVIVERSGRFILFYKKYDDEHRNRWSYAHESGHFYLGHELNVEKLTKEQYKLQEDEADFFAAQVLMPDLIIWELVDRGASLTIENITKWFDVSKKAAEIRMRTLNRQSEFRKYYKNEDYLELLMIKFSSYVDAIIPKYNRYSSYDYDDEELQKERDKWY